MLVRTTQVSFFYQTWMLTHRGIVHILRDPVSLILRFAIPTVQVSSRNEYF